MNVKRILGLLAMLVGFLIPFQYSYLDISVNNNVIGLIGFIVFLTLVFVGYALVDSSYPKPGSSSHEEAH